jgi:hypothetical protein
VFDPHRAWADAVAQLVFDAASGEARGRYELPFSEPSQIVAETSDPAHWLIGERELTIRFEGDGPSCCATVVASIAWSKLRPYLRSPLPFVILPN